MDWQPSQLKKCVCGQITFSCAEHKNLRPLQEKHNIVA